MKLFLVVGPDLPAVFWLLGLLKGLSYGLLGVGLTLVYRSSRFINFAHGDIGLFAAVVVGVLVLDGNVPYWVALPAGLLAGAGVGGLVELLVVRRLARAPRLMSMVATVGVGQFLFFLALVFGGRAASGAFFPVPPGLPDFTVGRVYIGTPYVAMAILAPLAVVGLTTFLTRSRFGIAIRGAAANPEAAAMAAMSPARLSTLTWAIAGALAALTTTLLVPLEGAQGATSLGPTLLVRALAAGVIGRMNNLMATFVAGIAIGEIDVIVQYLSGGGGLREVFIFGVILVCVLLQSRPGRREEEKGSWATVQPWPPLPEAMTRFRAVRSLGRLLLVPAAIAAVVVPHVASSATLFNLSVLGGYVVIGLALYIVTGLSGQLSLGQVAVAGAGAVAAIQVAMHTHHYELGVLAGAAVGVGAAVVIGIPAMRVRGLMLAVTSLAFATTMSGYVLQHTPPIGFGSSQPIGDVSLFGIAIDTTVRAWWLAVCAVALALLVAANIRRTGFGRLLTALRDNEDAARAFGVGATARKLQGYAVAGALAGIGGTVVAFVQPAAVNAGNFPSQLSTTVVITAVVGGIGLVAGPLLGIAVAWPSVAAVEPATQVAITSAWLLLILVAPNGVAGVLRPLRERTVDLLTRWSGGDPVAARRSADPALAEQSPPRPPALVTPAREPVTQAGLSPVLTVRGLGRSYGGLRAVDGVDLDVHDGEILGLIGPNGAGKTTLFELLSGFVRADSGTIEFAGHRLAGPRPGWGGRFSVRPEVRAELGLVRSFQDSALFATMTVRETLLVACDLRNRSHVLACAAGLDRADRARDARARELLALLGLERYRHLQVGALSTGTRRIVELACVVALAPRLLLLDEPSSGIAQREVEALGEVLLGIRRHLGATLVVIEHDIPLVSRLSDRMVAMETGRILAVGPPATVLSDPRVVESYLGGDPTAVHRSGAATADPPPLATAAIGVS